MPSGIEIHGLGLSFGPKEVLRDISLSIAEGERVAIVGPSGCGKTSLLRTIAGLLAVTSGSIVIRSADGSTSKPPLPEGKTGFMLQNPLLLPWRSAANNIRLPLEVIRARRLHAERTLSVESLLEIMNLTQHGNSYPNELSGGMKARVALARALITLPEILLMDEPFSSLDEITRRHVVDEVFALCDQHLPTVLLVTHSIEEALFVADRVIALSSNPGMIVGEIAVPELHPRQPSYRDEECFRENVLLLQQLLSDIEV